MQTGAGEGWERLERAAAKEWATATIASSGALTSPRQANTQLWVRGEGGGAAAQVGVERDAGGLKSERGRRGGVDERERRIDTTANR